MGLLALAISAPDEAFTCAMGTFRQLPSAKWFLATYMLRYLHVDETVPFLTRLAEQAAGTPLEDVVVGALLRHISEPAALARVLSLVHQDASPGIVRLIFRDLARHLPTDQAPDAAATARTFLSLGPDPRLAGPALVALGSLGTASDLSLVASHAPGPAGMEAIHALELLMDPEGLRVLEELGRGGESRIRGAAIVAAFRLGNLEAVSMLEALAREPEGREAAATALLAMALSIRCIPAISRLSLLYSALSDRATRRLAPPGRDEPTAPAQAPACPELESVLVRSRPKVAAGPMPAIARVPAGTGRGIYGDLGHHLLGLELEDAGLWSRRVIPLLALAVALLLLVRTARERALFTGRPPIAVASLGALAGSAGAGACGLARGQIIEGNATAPVVLDAAIPPNSLSVTGRLRVLDVHSVPDNPRSCGLVVALLEGGLKVDQARGRGTLVVESAGTRVELGQARARLELGKKRLTVAVYFGRVRVTPPSGEPLTLLAGQRAELEGGRLAGPVRTLDLVQDRW